MAKKKRTTARVSQARLEKIAAAVIADQTKDPSRKAHCPKGCRYSANVYDVCPEHGLPPERIERLVHVEELRPTSDKLREAHFPGDGDLGDIRCPKSKDGVHRFQEYVDTDLYQNDDGKFLCIYPYCVHCDWQGEVTLRVTDIKWQRDLDP